ncbi:hypothetical protein [Virgibacillus halodenitrificans]|uniref:hypothetical protein n=1 Tax=Virgibacillus halodenitrificans TaxID=1482 RepID=UPI0013CEF7A2|nr:hypothetical protein [Virgibacillus halodenitrificans]
MKIGSRIYFERESGNILIIRGERQGPYVKQTSITQDIETYKALSERNRDTFDYIELEYGQYAQDFAESNGYRVNPTTRKLEFSYPDPNAPEEPQPYQAPLSEEVKQLKNEDLNNKEAIADLYVQVMGGTV